jgi:hypothetical protein
MATGTRESIISYLVTHAATLHPEPIRLLVAHLRRLADDDERLLTLGTLAVRGGQFAPGPGTHHALTQFTGSTIEDCERFLSMLSRVARDDALAHARQRGFLPRQRPM